MTSSPFEVRGVIEGFHGRPWTQRQRVEMVEFLAERGMNTFVYAPKDDPKLRDSWRAGYDPDELERLRELVDRCRSVGMDPMWCISPGLSVRYSHSDDVATLVSKIGDVLALGVRHIGLFFDDIPPRLQYAQDRATYSGLEQAQISLANAVLESLPTEAHVIFCPTEYWGRGDEDSLARLGAGLDPRIDLFWTGPAVCAAALDLVDAEVFTRTAKRPPTYWDNYPVNDLSMSYELHIGPYRRRDPELWKSSKGIIANAMELYEASKIPLATIADYLSDPSGYDAEVSWRRAIRDVVGEADEAAFVLFADNVRGSCLSTQEAPIVEEAMSTARFEMAYGDHAAGLEGLTALAARMLEAADHLLRGPVVNRQLMQEVRPWLLGFEIGARAVHRIADLTAAGRLEDDGPAELASFLIELRRARVRVFGDYMERTLSVMSRTSLPPGEVPVPPSSR
jgi:hyaluronoglucosaminidase